MHYEQTCHIASCVQYGNAVHLTKPLTNQKLTLALQALDASTYVKAAALQRSFKVDGSATAAAIIRRKLSDQ